MNETEYQQGYRLGYQHGRTKEKIDIITHINSLLTFQMQFQKTERSESYMNALKTVKEYVENREGVNDK